MEHLISRLNNHYIKFNWIFFRLIKHIESYKLKNEFSIDMAWEFAKFVLDSSNTKLTHESKLCIVSTLNCATYVRYLEACVCILQKLLYKNI